MVLVEKRELKYILFAGGFSFVYFIYLLPYLLNRGIANASPYTQFLLFSLGIYFVLFFVFKSFAMQTKYSLSYAFVMVLTFISMDIAQPEYHINPLNGVLEAGATLGKSSSDYVAGTFWQGLGFSGYILVPLVYFVTFTSLLIIASLIERNFVRRL